MSQRTLSLRQRTTRDALRGKTIARVVLHPFGTGVPGDSEPATDPAIHFTDGTCLRFVVEETEVGEYGVRLVYPARK